MAKLTTDQLVSYFDGEATTNEAGRIEEQLARDPDARARLDRLGALRGHLRGSTAVGAEPDFVQDVVRNVRTGGSNARRFRPLLLGAPVLAAASAALLLFVLPGERGTLTPRGEVATPDLDRYVGIEVLRHTAGGAGAALPLRPGDTLNDGDRMSFIATNRSGRSLYVLLFARDANGTLHWLYPASPSGAAPQLDPTPVVRTLPEGIVATGLADGSLQVVALLSPTPPDPDAVAIQAGHGLDALRELDADATVQVLPLTFRPTAR